MIQTLLRRCTGLGSTAYAALSPRFTVLSGFPGLVEVVWPVSGTFRNLRTVLGTVPGGSATRTFALTVNQVDSALTTTHTSAVSAAQDTANNVAVTAGDILLLTGTGTSSPATSALDWSVDFDSEDDFSSAYSCQIGTTHSGFIDPFTGLINATADECRRYIPCAGIITEMWAADTFGPVSTGTLTFYLYKNGVKQDGTGGTVNTATALASVAQYVSVVGSFSLPVARGDYIYIGVEETGTSNADWITVGIRFEATTALQAILAMAASGTPSSSVANYCIPCMDNSTGAGGWLGTSTDDARLLCGVSDVSVKDAIVVCSTDPGSGNTRTFEKMKNGAASSAYPQAIISAGVLTKLDNHIVSFVTGDTIGPMRHTPASTPTVTGIEYWSLVISNDSTLTGGGGGGFGPIGVNPTLGIVPSVAPEIFAIFTLNGVDYPFGVGQLNDDPSWFAGRKDSKIKDISSIKYALTKEGGPESVSFTITVYDGDRVFHDRAGTTAQIKGGFVSVYVIDHDDRIAELVPKRLAAGYITKYRGSDDFTFTFTVKDALSIRLAKVDKEPSLPPGRFTATDYPGLDPSADGKSIPLVLGRMSDEAATVVQGDTPPMYLGATNLNVFGGINKPVDAYIWSQGAFVANGITQIWYNSPTTPLVRNILPASVFGVYLWTPFWPGWLTDTGQSVNYLVFNGIRFMPFFIDSSIPEAALVRQGNILVAANCHGVDAVGDGTGLMVDSPPYVTTLVLTNWVFGRYLTGTFGAIPDYSHVATTPWTWIDTDTFDDVHDYFVSRLGGSGYTVGSILGADGNPQTVFQFLQEMCSGVWMDIGKNFEGQLIACVYDPLDPAIATFDATSDIENLTYSVELNEQRAVNRVEHEFAYYFVPPYAPAPTPAEGDPAPSTPIPAHSEYRSGVHVTEDTAAQANMKEIVTFKLQNKWVRDATVGADVSNRILAEGLGPTGYGPHEFTLRGGWQLLGSGMRLGKNIYVKHPAKFGTGARDLCRVTTIEILPLTHRVVLGGDVMEHE